MESDGFDQELEIEVKLDLGELRYLSQVLASAEREEDISIVKKAYSDEEKKNLPPNLNTEQSYGNPLSPVEAAEAVPTGSDGLIRHAIVVPDHYCVNGKLLRGLNKRDFDVAQGTIKPRRASLPITRTDLMSSLTKVVNDETPRYIFNGILNGWPSLRHFELIGLEKRKSLLGGVKPPEYIMGSIGQAWTSHWKTDKEGLEDIPPEIPEKGEIYRATLRGAPWTSLGWSPTSPGFVFWFQAQHFEGPRVVYGSDAVSKMGDDVCKAVHMISHRYATKRESPRDKVNTSIVTCALDHHLS
mmetsp:Transcript_17126/g.35166  ORF Transcript_17126/g.35166 Transcript_17126/m.35166 type:complete len:299 (-) Transcript_17126:2684-3580(-)